ncbi:hypothetical protein [Mesomycoplasma neurolyticum]|uniref:Uncharacterized protein n=1 Tax=Mesomycoplasma neurolyticum TaxID=2120 RepID=A0A449A524_9BACT|nr:hypothetical protein [Mesomycoplasma neurolyticum]VEU59322.1 Uncharacterised protein [Mesomycoplasma neurolyticum]
MKKYEDYILEEAIEKFANNYFKAKDNNDTSFTLIYMGVLEKLVELKNDFNNGLFDPMDEASENHYRWGDVEDLYEIEDELNELEEELELNSY